VGFALLVTAVLTIAVPAAGRVQAPATETTLDATRIGAAITSFGNWTESPAHVRLFAPPPHQSEYRAFVSNAALDDVLSRLAGAQPGPPGAWRPQPVSSLDAFGSSGTYNRFQLARMYVGNSVRTAHGPWLTAAGLEAWTLVSPYPNAALDKVEPGTLLIVLRVPPL
jgi:hypothetical protein